MKTFVMGDIHGAYKALLQCLERSSFDYRKDRLIVLGDVCDGYPEVKQCIDELLKIKHCDYIIGNHDLWVLQWAQEDWSDPSWLRQGGYNTVASYGGKKMPEAHVCFLEKARPWIEENSRLFVHGGFEPTEPIARQAAYALVWDRDLFYNARRKSFSDPDFKFAGYEDIFIGHTTTQTFNSLEPLRLCNVWALDTGAGWSGKLTIMDIETKKYWQSDFSRDLYPEVLK